MHDFRLITEGRLDRFLTERIEPSIYTRSEALSVSMWEAPDEPVPAAQALSEQYKPFEVGQPWGKPWGTVWFHITGTVPADFGKTPGHTVELLVDLGFNINSPGFQCEGIVWNSDGTIVKALSPRNNWIPVAGPTIDLYVEAAANPNVAEAFIFAPTVLGDKATAGSDPIYRLQQVEVAERNDEVWALRQDIWTLRGLMRELSTEVPRRADLLTAFESMLNAMDPEDVPGTASAGRAELAEVMGRPAYASAHRIVATGHAHIDSAWLWPVRETIRKCARTFSNVVALMDAYPEFVFSCSSAQQLAWMKEFYPDLFLRIKEKVKAGQFVPVGGMWVESDTNMPGGEALARQFVVGKTFFLEEFGVDTQEVWLPDSFGYSGALPQIVKAAGSKWFLTQKISWNQTNKFPHHTFEWEGIDGTRVFTHFPPVDTYNSELSGAELAHAQRNYREKGRGNVSLVPFGWGDGGGGPTREMLAAAARTNDLEGSPRVRIGSASSFFQEAQDENKRIPVWVGEMYLELHRGTYTSQSNTKRGNRRSEHLLREAELWATTATIRNGAQYPYEELSRIWQLVLLQQFHDILPGSSISWVHQDAERNYAAISRDLESVITKSAEQAAGIGDIRLLLNATPHSRDGVSALGAAPIKESGAPVATSVKDGVHVLDNGLIKAAVDSAGRLVSLVDYASGRESIAPNTFGNHLELHRDIPNQWDAWDIDEHYRQNVTSLEETTRPVMFEEGMACVVVARNTGKSEIIQRISLTPGAKSISITTEIDWQENDKLLKLGFPFDVRADRSAAETQFGHVFRPTHENTSWEAAKFEICAHRWIHVGEPGYGVAVTNDASYGHDVSRSIRDDGGTTTRVRLSLLRAPKYPDPNSDRGPHSFTVTVRPGAEIADAVEEGYRTNLTARMFSGAHTVEPLFVLSNPGIVIEAVKLAEDHSGDVIVRLYESLGQRSTGTIQAGFATRSVNTTDLLERDHPGEAGVATGTDHAKLTLRPFQLVTLRFTR
ncbi:alpha-mannosidase [Arthrobacter silviterrae]|uniref:Alpha-mannosidase n=1 Tax=Arthrobacter silviterrae TaxID=2026658 RepID=A0ABX0DGP5_9MICC|nr:glycoside hydrolase family 38 C-terminal domain-containing protein [Arthrobacter silviterrae]MDQ0276608.1 alpha-mannosidase [Arthrobacter silviterrae]NGN84549.1 alpha-mannosidase [Arthrobacter silviterrae]